MDSGELNIVDENIVGENIVDENIVYENIEDVVKTIINNRISFINGNRALVKPILQLKAKYIELLSDKLKLQGLNPGEIRGKFETHIQLLKKQIEDLQASSGNGSELQDNLRVKIYTVEIGIIRDHMKLENSKRFRGSSPFRNFVVESIKLMNDYVYIKTELKPNKNNTDRSQVEIDNLCKQSGSSMAAYLELLKSYFGLENNSQKEIYDKLQTYIQFLDEEILGFKASNTNGNTSQTSTIKHIIVNYEMQKRSIKDYLYLVKTKDKIIVEDLVKIIMNKHKTLNIENDYVPVSTEQWLSWYNTHYDLKYKDIADKLEINRIETNSNSRCPKINMMYNIKRNVTNKLPDYDAGKYIKNKIKTENENFQKEDISIHDLFIYNFKIMSTIIFAVDDDYRESVLEEWENTLKYFLIYISTDLNYDNIFEIITTRKTDDKIATLVPSYDVLFQLLKLEINIFSMFSDIKKRVKEDEDLESILKYMKLNLLCPELYSDWFLKDNKPVNDYSWMSEEVALIAEGEGEGEAEAERKKARKKEKEKYIEEIVTFCKTLRECYHEFEKILFECKPKIPKRPQPKTQNTETQTPLEPLDDEDFDSVLRYLTLNITPYHKEITDLQNKESYMTYRFFEHILLNAKCEIRCDDIKDKVLRYDEVSDMYKETGEIDTITFNDLMAKYKFNFDNGYVRLYIRFVVDLISLLQKDIYSDFSG